MSATTSQQAINDESDYNVAEHHSKASEPEQDLQHQRKPKRKNEWVLKKTFDSTAQAKEWVTNENQWAYVKAYDSSTTTLPTLRNKKGVQRT